MMKCLDELKIGMDPEVPEWVNLLNCRLDLQARSREATKRRKRKIDSTGKASEPGIAYTVKMEL